MKTVARQKPKERRNHCGSGNKPKHILLVSQYFHPETFRVNDMAAAWVKRGYKVTVLTGIPNYPMGKFFDGYGYRTKRHEQWKGIEIIRIPLIPRGNSQNKFLNAIGMAANYFSFVFFGRVWVGSRKARKLDADLVFTFEVSPMTQALIGCWYGERYGVPIYLYVQDLWPENVEMVTGIHNRTVLAPLERMVKHIYEHTDQIFTTSPSFVKEIVKRGVDKNRVNYWPQYAEEFYRPENRAEAEEKLKKYSAELASLVEKVESEDAFYIAFTGNIGKAQGLDILPGVAEKLSEDERLGSIAKPVRFIIVGDGRYQGKLEQMIEEKNVGHMFIFVSRQKQELIPDILALADAAFLSFAPDKLWEMTIPAKLQSYMACGQAIIAAAGGETERVINEAECGVCVPIGNNAALAEAIYQMLCADLAKMRGNSQKYAKSCFSKAVLMDEMDEYLMIGSKGRS